MFLSCLGSPMITPNAAVKIRMWFAIDRFSSSSSMWKIQNVHHIEYRWQGNKNSPTMYLLMGLIPPSIFLFPKMKLKFLLLPLKILGHISRVSSQYLASFISNSPNFKLTFKTFFPSDKRIFELFFFFWTTNFFSPIAPTRAALLTCLSILDINPQHHFLTVEVQWIPVQWIPFLQRIYNLFQQRSHTHMVVVVQLPSCVQLFETPGTAASHASLSLTISGSLSKFMSIELVMPHGTRNNNTNR